MANDTMTDRFLLILFLFFSFVLQKKNGQTDARYNSSAPVFTVDI